MRDQISALRWKLRVARHRIRSVRARYRLATIDFKSGLGDSASLLYGLARSLKPKVCVEIGSARGMSACYVGVALMENGSGKIYAIDPHAKTSWNDSHSVETLPVIEHNIRYLGLTKYVEIVHKTSDEAVKEWSQPIDLLFIDGDHTYEGVRRDWEMFSPFLTEFGVTVFHDTIWDLDPDPRWYRSDMGVPRFVEDLRKEGYPVLTINQDYGVSILQGTKTGIALSRQGSRRETE
jgi:predicted O-methyltransferase YrrM